MASRELASSSPASVAKLSSEDMLFVEVTRSNYEVPADKQLLRAVERYWLFRQSRPKDTLSPHGESPCFRGLFAPRLTVISSTVRTLPVL